MPAYYNEIDPAAAAWLRELIKQGHIAPGDVDERSIEDVYPNDLRGYTQCHFFAGIGVWSHALRQAGWPDDRPVWTGSCPCQPFSAAGKGAGFADERHLWPAFHHLIGQCRPPVVFGEQVASKDGLAWLDLVQADLERAGYACGALDTCAAGFGAPHIRQRLYWVAHATEQHHKGRGRVWQAGWAEPANDSQPHGLGHAIGARLEGHVGHGHAEGGRTQQAGSVAPAGSVGGVDDAYGQRCHGQHALLRAEEAGWHATGVPEAAGAGTADRPGPTNGHWRAADWLLCRDERWRPAEPGTCPLVDGTAAVLVPVCTLCASKKKGGLNVGLSQLWEIDGGYEGQKQEEVLLRCLHGAAQNETSDEQKHGSPTSPEAAERHSLSEMWSNGKVTSTSQRQKPYEQQLGKPGGSMRYMPPQRTRQGKAYVGVRSLWKGFCGGEPQEQTKDMQCVLCGGVGASLRLQTMAQSRATKLKAYGNAIVAPQAQAFVEAVMGV